MFHELGCVLPELKSITSKYKFQPSMLVEGATLRSSCSGHLATVIPSPLHLTPLGSSGLKPAARN